MEFKDLGFVSTSVDKNIAKNFFKDIRKTDDAIFMKIKIPKGTRVGIGRFEDIERVLRMSEGEIILNKGTTFIIEKAVIEDGRKTLYMKVVKTIPKAIPKAPVWVPRNFGY